MTTKSTSITKCWDPWIRLLLGLMITAASALTVETAHADIVPITIVSIGDSYASGEGAPDKPGAGLEGWQGDNRDNKAGRCHRSNLAAPAVAAKLVGAQRPVNFLHLACTGHTIRDLIDPGGQLDQIATFVDGPIDALIISIGGNDIDFANIVIACVAAPCELVLPESFPQAAIALAPKIAAINKAILALPVSVRHVFITEYPDPSTTFFPPPDHRCGTPFAPNIPFSGFDVTLPSTAEWAANIVIAPLNDSLYRAVTSVNSERQGEPMWHFIGGISAAFHGHGYCMGLPNPIPHMWIAERMINTVRDSWAIQGDPNGSMHPNAAGYKAAAGVIANSILTNVPIEVTPPAPKPTPISPRSSPISSLVCLKKSWTPGCSE